MIAPFSTQCCDDWLVDALNFATTYVLNDNLTMALRGLALDVVKNMYLEHQLAHSSAIVEKLIYPLALKLLPYSRAGSAEADGALGPNALCAQMMGIVLNILQVCYCNGRNVRKNAFFVQGKPQHSRRRQYKRVLSRCAQNALVGRVEEECRER